MGMIQEFKEFALGGNMVDMAVGIVVGGAVSKLVTAMVDDLINPIVGMFTGGVDFSSLSTNLAGPDAEPLKLLWGAFISSGIDFLILMFVIFIIIKMINNARKALVHEKPAVPSGPTELEILTEIRDALRK